MSGLGFLLVRGMRNNLRELRRKPGKLALYIVCLFFMGLAFFANGLTRAEADGFLDILLLKGILFAYLLMFFLIAIHQGLSSGSALFGMEDVNLLFVSPLNPRSILLYGVFRMMKSVALGSVFILFQAVNLAHFGIGGAGILVIYAGYFLTTAVSQILGLFIYSYTNGRTFRQNLVKLLACAVFVPLLVAAFLSLSQAGWELMPGLMNLLRSPVLDYTPLLGWVSAGTVAFLSGDMVMGAVFYALLAALGAVLVGVIYLGKPDYYEDVLVASETQFEKKRALAEGQVNLEAHAQRRVTVKGTGVGGLGASAVFSKHLRESFRANRFGLWGLSSLLLIAAAAAFAWFLRQDELGPFALYTVLFTAMWMQVFLVGTGRGLKETYSHYLFLIPENPFRKLVWSNMELMLKAAAEGALLCLAAGLVAGAGALDIALGAVCYTLFTFVLVGINFVSLRFTGANVSAGLLILIYMLAVLLVMAPGIVAAIVVGAVSGQILWGAAVLAGWELLAGCACFWAGKGILHNCDMSVMKTPGG